MDIQKLDVHDLSQRGKVLQTAVKFFETTPSGKVEFDLSSQDFSDPQIEDFFWDLEENFLLQEKEISIKVAPSPDTKQLRERRKKLAEILKRCEVITEIVVKGPKNSVESLVRFLRNKYYVTVPIRAEIA